MANNLSSTPHDSAFKGFMTKLDNARDFFDIYLPSRIKRLCYFDTLSLTSASFVDKTLRSRLSDMLYSVETERGEGYLYLLVEHQSTPDKLMGWRLMHYAFSAMNQHLQQGNKTLPLVVPILFYHGKQSPYPYSQSWTDCFQWSDLAYDLYCNPLPLVDITVVNDDEIVNHRKIAAMELVLKHSSQRDNLLALSERLTQVFNNNQNHQDDVILVINYLFSVMDTPTYTHIVKTLVNQTGEHQEIVMNIAQRLRNEGIEKGIEKGREEERIIARQQMRLNLQKQVVTSLKLGLSIDVISQITGLSLAEIQALC
ncbi:MAG: Rpn family recombination-promoting nuclease/putative transposase [Providencia rustigianii]|uniref:Rpn family recombination-promoting nuclease/putative transposase n=1 Tax=Providencia rustigianii TaxID=158850 RepID=UPI000D9CA2B4|nr:Rpn family recombination-promoting nuclease/putative transposase [Providencia rustigianii]SPY76928.1 Putative transposase, YhgA-like [Providencia rustigianii]